MPTTSSTSRRWRCAWPTKRDAGRGAALFHATLVSALADWVARAARAQQLGTVACGGGCFLNALLAGGLQRELAARGLTMLQAQAVPPNDGGLSLGQAWVALAGRHRFLKEIQGCVSPSPPASSN